MLNKNNLRELAYAVTVDDLTPIEGADRVEAAHIGGWQTMVPKGRFVKGQAAVYFEIDSRLPAVEAFAFMQNKGYKVKTQKYTFGGRNKEGFYSQGLLVHPDDLGDEYRLGFAPTQPEYTFIDKIGKNGNWGEKVFIPGDMDTMFMTEELGVTYATAEDRKRKGGDTIDKYQKMANKLGPRMKKPVIKWLFKRTWGKKLLWFFYKKELDKNPKKFPTHMPYVCKTDQERVENLPWDNLVGTTWYETEKCDGTSSTYILERTKKGYEYYVCSRNVRQLDRNQKNYHNDVNGEDTNVYWEMNDKYGIYDALVDFLDKHEDIDYICLQGETCGPKLQGNPQKLKENHLYVFHIITSNKGRWSIPEINMFCFQNNLEMVPVTDPCYTIPADFEEFKLHADGKYQPCVVGKGSNPNREGFVYYAIDDPNRSFKNVSREYLAKKK